MRRSSKNLWWLEKEGVQVEQAMCLFKRQMPEEAQVCTLHEKEQVQPAKEEMRVDRQSERRNLQGIRNRFTYFSLHRKYIEKQMQENE